MALRRVNPLLSKLLAIPIKERVKPHQKLIAVGTLIDAAKDGFTVRFCLSVQAQWMQKGGLFTLELSAAWKQLRSPHGWVYGVSRRAYTRALSKRHKKAHLSALFWLVLLSLD